MSEEKRYTDEQWDDLPLPDGELAWQKMEVLLDKEKKRRVLPFWLWRFAGLGLLLIGLGVGAWLMWFKNAEKTQTAIVKERQPVQTKAKQQTDKKSTSITTVLPGQPNSERGKDILVIDDQPLQTLPSQKPVAKNERNKTRNYQEVAKKTLGKSRANTSLPAASHITPDANSFPGKPTEDKALPLTFTAPETKQAVLDSSKITDVPVKDSTTKKDTLATKAAEPLVSNGQKKDSGAKKKPFVFTAGVGLQQAIAFGGQESSAYNYKGKQNSLSERIPSVYLRLQKGKWFAQAEFQYAVPQPVKQFSFSQKTRYDVASSNLNTEQLTIRKLYYHQLPVSVNYFVLRNWSVGTGGMYSILAGAVTEQEVKSKNVQSGTESVARSIAPVQGYRDSFLYKSTAGILFQTDYHWKRFSLGLRYTQNLEPFIKYTRPDGVLLNEKNRSLQAILRFRLF